MASSDRDYEQVGLFTGCFGPGLLLLSLPFVLTIAVVLVWYVFTGN